MNCRSSLFILNNMNINNKGIALTAFVLAGMPNAWAQKTSKPDKLPVNIVLFVADDLGGEAVHDGRMGIGQEIHGNERLIGIRKNALKFAF